MTRDAVPQQPAEAAVDGTFGRRLMEVVNDDGKAPALLSDGGEPAAIWEVDDGRLGRNSYQRFSMYLFQHKKLVDSL